MKYFKQAGDYTKRMKYILETERDWIRKISIKRIQDKVTKFEEQLGNVNTENSHTDKQYCSSIIEGKMKINKTDSDADP